LTIAVDGIVSATRCNILSRRNPEDPWISLAADHDPFLTIWGENGADISPHTDVKNNNGGINVYVRSTQVGRTIVKDHYHTLHLTVIVSIHPYIYRCQRCACQLHLRS